MDKVEWLKAAWGGDARFGEAGDPEGPAVTSSSMQLKLPSRRTTWSFAVMLLLMATTWCLGRGPREPVFKGKKLSWYPSRPTEAIEHLIPLARTGDLLTRAHILGALSVIDTGNSAWADEIRNLEKSADPQLSEALERALIHFGM